MATMICSILFIMVWMTLLTRRVKRQKIDNLKLRQQRLADLSIIKELNNKLLQYGKDKET